MATLYTDVVLSLHGLADGDSVTVDCPVDTRMILRNIDAAAGAAVDLPFLHIEDLITGGTIAILAVGGLFLQSVQWEGRQAFNYGGGFVVRAENNSWDVRCTAFLLAA